MTDAPVRVRIGDEEAIVHTEFQTETSRVPMELRLAEYVGRLIREYGIPVYVTVIYLGESAGVNDPGGYHYALDNAFSYSLRYQVIRFFCFLRLNMLASLTDDPDTRDSATLHWRFAGLTELHKKQVIFLKWTDRESRIGKNL